MQTAWGSREGADINDAYRMIRVNQSEREYTAGIREKKGNIYATTI